MRVWQTFLMAVVLVLLLLPASAGRASPYWIAYEGNDFPENDGWYRFMGAGGGLRSIEDSWFVLDTRASIAIYDYYQKRLNGALDPGPGETFVMRWRLLITEVQGRSDPGIGVRSDENWAVAFEYASDRLWSLFESGVSHAFEPGIPHTYELRSDDMRTYRLYVDDVLALQGSFWLSLSGSRVTWGDGMQGGASLTSWDYVRFGVIPEPATAITSVYGLVWAFRRGSRPARDERN